MIGRMELLLIKMEDSGMNTLKTKIREDGEKKKKEIQRCVSYIGSICWEEDKSISNVHKNKWYGHKKIQ